MPRSLRIAGAPERIPTADRPHAGLIAAPGRLQWQQPTSPADPGATPLPPSRRIPAGDGQVPSLPDRTHQVPQNFRWMLAVRVHHPKNFRVRVLPAMQNGPRESSFVPAQQQTHPCVFPGDRSYNRLGSIPAVIVHDQDLEPQIELSQRIQRALQHLAEILPFSQRGNHQRQRLSADLSNAAHFSPLAGPGTVRCNRR